jgi:hypothetical protein
MKKKKILIITPVEPFPSSLETIISPLDFLNEDYSFHLIDSLSIMKDSSNEEYYSRWEQELIRYLPNYDAFFGFSFGGVILQQCFSLFTQINKPIILFSTPTFADDSLTKRLGKVISLCKENKLDEALHALYKEVYYPNEMPPQAYESINTIAAIERLIFGLSRVLGTDSTAILKENEVNHLHLIGEQSHLVNKDNVIAPRIGTLICVPEAGMRMLKDNLPFCKKALLETLNSGTK